MKDSRLAIDRRSLWLLSFGLALSALAAPAHAASVAVGSSYTLLSDGSGNVWAWGHNANGQLGTGDTTASTLPTAVSGVSSVSAVSAGSQHSLALKGDGTVWAWGYNGNGRLGDGTTTPRLSPVQVSGLTGIVAVSAGDQHSLALASDGIVWAWGRNNSGQLGDGSTTDRLTPVALSGVSGVSAISAGSAHSLAMTSAGSAYSWGSNSDGQLGDGTTTQSLTPVVVSGLSSVAAIAAGGVHSLAVTSDGSVYGWGSNANGRLGDGTTTQRLTPVSVSGLTQVTAVAAGVNYSLARRSDGTVWAWGNNTNGRLGDGTQTHRLTPVPTSGLSSVASISASSSSSHGLALTSDLTLWAWGPNGNGRLGDGTTVDRWLPVKIAEAGLTWKVGTPFFSPAGGTYTEPQTVTVACVTAGAQIRYTTDGSEPTASSTLYTEALYFDTGTTLKAKAFKTGLADSNTGPATYTMNFGILEPPVMSPLEGTYDTEVLVTVSALPGATIRYTTNGSTPTVTSPIYTAPLLFQATTTLKVKAFHPDWTASDVWTAVYTIRAAAPVFSQTAGTYAAGTAITITGSTPGATITYTLDGAEPLSTDMPIASGASVLVGNYTLKAKAWKTGCTPSATTTATYQVTGSYSPGVVARGGYHSMAARPDGRVWAWGYAGFGALGTGNTTSSTLPVPVRGITGVKAVSAGTYHSLALKADGTVWAWGHNTFYQLGDGTTTSRSSPVPVSGLTGIISIAAGDYHSLAVAGDGTVYAWGHNADGRLGDGTTDSRPTPVALGGISGAAKVAAGAIHSVAVTSGGSVYAWGSNASGRLGDGTTTPSLTPIQVPGLSGVVAAAVGNAHNLALTSTGAVYAWGANGNGRLGDGTTTNRFSPVLISSLSNVSAIAAGLTFSSAYTSDGTGWSWGFNAYGQLGDGTTTQRLSPVAVVGPANVVAISTGSAGSNALAVTSAGEVWAWGYNSHGQVGDGTEYNRLFPVKVAEAGFLWKAGTPILNPVSGAFEDAVTVSITTASVGATIRYTTDGTEPTAASTPYAGPIGLDITTTLKAQAFQTGWGDSNVGVETYTVFGVLNPPTVNPATATYNAPVTVSMSAQSGAAIRYTTDGSEPTSSSSLYSTPFVVDVTRTVRAKAFKIDWTPSSTTDRTYTLKVGTPTVSVPSGTYGSAQQVAITTVSPGATLRYTTNSVEPVETDLPVGAQVTVDRSMTLQAKGWRAGWTPSDTAAATYFVNLGAVANPTFSPAGGSFTTAKTVSLTSATSQAEIRYTLDGSDPTAQSPVYAAPITVAATATLKARAFKAEMAPSAVVSQTYTIDLGTAETPTVNVASGRYTTQRTITITAPTADVIRYTTTGVDPTETDTSIASGATLLVDRSMIVQVKAWKSGLPPSAVVRRDYVITGAIAAGDAHTLALKADRTVWSWGYNGYSQLGRTGTTGAPGQVAGLSAVVAIAAGGNHSLALKADGTVAGFGHNAKGQVGIGSTNSPVATPAPVAGLTGVIAIAAGGEHSLALKSDGKVMSWGYRYYGQLGLGSGTYASCTTNECTSPVEIPGLTDVVAIAAGANHSLALKSDGTLVAFGADGAGQIGNGTIAFSYTTPQTALAPVGLSRILGGGDFSLALKSDGLGVGVPWLWGANANGQLGDGTQTNRDRPASGPSGFVTLAAGNLHTLGLAYDGGLWSWGAGANGALGDLGLTDRLWPVRVMSAPDVLDLDAGQAFSLAIASDGRVFGWGINGQSQASGNGEGTDKTEPFAVPSFLLADNAWLATDVDQDGLSNASEYRIGTDPLNADSNGDGLPDGLEMQMGRNASSPDSDGDGLINVREIELGTDPNKADTDGDGVLDGSDAFPLDATQSQATPNPSDTTPPTVTLQEPTNAVEL